MPIPQNLNALPPQRPLYRVSAYTEIVIPEHGDNARTRAKAAKYLSDRLDRRSGICDEVAGERNQVGFESIRQFHNRSDVVQRHEQAVVDIAQLQYAESTKSFRQVTKPDSLRRNSQAAAESVCLFTAA